MYGYYLDECAISSNHTVSANKWFKFSDWFLGIALTYRQLLAFFEYQRSVNEARKLIKLFDLK